VRSRPLKSRPRAGTGRIGGWLGAVLAAALLCLSPAARAEPTLFNILDFQFEDGTVLPDVHVAYQTQGALSSARDNAILLVPGAIGGRRAFDAAIGPGKTFDTDKYFVITADPIGGGDSSAPADGMGQDFPRYTIRDMMTAEAALVAQGLQLPMLRAICGTGMGSDVALELAVNHPELVRGVILLAPSPVAERGLQLVLDLLTSVVALDPEWQGGRYSRNPIEGLRHAGMLYYPWTVTAGYIDRITQQRLDHELAAAARSFANWDANALVLRYGAYRAHDVAAPFSGDFSAALARIAAPLLLLPSASDRLVSVGGAKRIRDGIKQAAYAEIPGDLGHSAIRAMPETAAWDFIDARIRTFLANLK
jgi:homoserine O-acetyltransferase